LLVVRKPQSAALRFRNLRREGGVALTPIIPAQTRRFHPGQLAFITD
jgi:hypothetical protein